MYGESIFLRFSYRSPSDEGAMSLRKNRRQILSSTDQTNEVNKTFFMSVLVHFPVLSALSVFNCCRLPYLWATWFCFNFALVMHSFALLKDKQLSIKATWMFHNACYCSNVPIKAYLILFYFHLNQFRNFPSKIHRSGEKRIALSQRLGGRYAFLQTSQQPISVRHDLKRNWAI